MREDGPRMSVGGERAEGVGGRGRADGLVRESGRRCGRPPAVRAVRQPPLNGETSGLVLEYRPAGFGYQIHTCIVVRSGCQKLNGEPVFGFVFGQVFEFSSGMKVPSL